jgi:hypothetical protein
MIELNTIRKIVLDNIRVRTNDKTEIRFYVQTRHNSVFGAFTWPFSLLVHTCHIQGVLVDPGSRKLDTLEMDYVLVESRIPRDKKAISKFIKCWEGLYKESIKHTNKTFTIGWENYIKEQFPITFWIRYMQLSNLCKIQPIYTNVMVIRKE